MAHKGVVIAGKYKLSTALGEGILFKQSAAAATTPTVEVCGAGEKPFGVIPVYPSPTDASNPKQDPAHSPPTRGAKKDDLLYGHYAGPPSEIIEVKLGADIPNAGVEVMCDASGQAITLAGSGKFAFGRTVNAGGKDGDIAEIHVVQQRTSS